MSCRQSLQKTADDGFTIWRTPYSETKLRSSGVELACEDRTENRERPMSCRRSLQKTADDGFTIWRTPYSETKLRSSGVELACEDRTENRERPMSCRRSLQKTADDGFTICGRHTARRRRQDTDYIREVRQI